MTTRDNVSVSNTICMVLPVYNTFTSSVSSNIRRVLQYILTKMSSVEILGSCALTYGQIC